MNASTRTPDRLLTLPRSPNLATSIRATAQVFEDPKSQALLEHLRQVAPSEASVLVIGETGTGKELVARHIHNLSARRNGPFVAVNDALLSGAIDIAGAGVGPLLTIWDRTRGRQNVKAVASLGNFPYYLLSNDPRVRSIADFGAGDRIAVPAVGVSVQSRFLQYAAAKQWGDKQFDRLDKYTVALPHPDATAALVAGGTELTGHFSNPPFQDQALANPKVHVVLDSYELLGPNSPTVLFATEKFRQDNPKTYRAFVEALKEAAAFAQNDKAAAADTYIRVTGAKIDRAALLKIIANPQVEFSVTPKNTYPLAEFLYRVGAIRNKPASWQDYFFQDGAPLQGS